MQLRRHCCLWLMLSLMLTTVAVGQDMAALHERVQPIVEELRGLEFRHAVEQAYQSGDELREVLKIELARSYPGDALKTLEKRLLKLGFVAGPIDLEAQLMRLYAQQIAGYYDPRAKRMVLIDKTTAPGAAGMSAVEWLSRWMIAGVGLSLEEILFAHELTHALQDQHFDLLSLPIEASDPEDAAAAARALVEGDATLVMFDYMLAPQGLDVTALPELSANLHAWVNSPLVRGVGMFRTIPRYMLDNLLFPYVHGFDFVRYLKERGGWELVNQAYQNPPVSTEQILHPEKYLDQPDLPSIVTLPDLPDGFATWRVIEQNTLGEFNIRLLLEGYVSSSEAQAASRGWDGDRFALGEHEGTGALLAVWFTVWDSDRDAQEFFRAARVMLDKRYGGDAPSGSARLGLPAPNMQPWSTPDGDVLLERRRRDVLLLDGVAAEDVEVWREHFWKTAVERRD